MNAATVMNTSALYTTAVGIVVTSNDPVAAILTLPKLYRNCLYLLLRLLFHRQLCATGEILACTHVEAGLLRWPRSKKQTQM